MVIVGFLSAKLGVQTTKRSQTNTFLEKDLSSVWEVFFFFFNQGAIIEWTKESRNFIIRTSKLMID